MYVPWQGECSRAVMFVKCGYEREISAVAGDIQSETGV